MKNERKAHFKSNKGEITYYFWEDQRNIYVTIMIIKNVHLEAIWEAPISQPWLV